MDILLEIEGDQFSLFCTWIIIYIMRKLTIKDLRWAQRAAGAGWNKHVSPWQRRKANKRLRRFLKSESEKEVALEI